MMYRNDYSSINIGPMLKKDYKNMFSSKFGRNLGGNAFVNFPAEALGVLPSIMYL